MTPKHNASRWVCPSCVYQATFGDIDVYTCTESQGDVILDMGVENEATMYMRRDLVAFARPANKNGTRESFQQILTMFDLLGGTK